MVWSIRPVTAEDADELGRVHAECWRQTYPHLLSPEALARLSPERLSAMWRRLAVDPSCIAVLAMADGRIAGFAGSGPSRDHDLAGRALFFIYLLAAHHGSGIGQALLDGVGGADHLWVASDNPRAHAFYRRNGFVPDGTEKVESFFGESIAETRMVRRRP